MDVIHSKICVYFIYILLAMKKREKKKKKKMKHDSNIISYHIIIKYCYLLQKRRPGPQQGILKHVHLSHIIKFKSPYYWKIL